MFTPRGVGSRPLRHRPGGVRRVLLVVLALAAVGAGGWTAWQYATAPVDDVRAQPRPSCPDAGPAPTVVPAGEVKVNVYNATERRGLAARVAGEMKRRGFVVRKVDNDPAKRKVTGAAEVRHSPAGADAARTVSAQVGEVVAVPDQRRNASVDLVLGAGFTQLLPPEQAATALSPSPEPVPSGC